MVTFFHDLSQRLQGTDGKHTNRAPSSAPHRRRRNAQLHRLLASLCAGLAIFAALQCVRLTISTQSVVIAAKSIAKGGVISADSLALRDIPYDEALRSVAHDIDEALRSVAHDIDDAVGLIAQVDIAEGSIVTSAMARASPVVPKGYTAVEVRLASSADSLTIGDTVTLSSATMFSEATPETVPDMDAVSLRELCTGAILTAKPSRNADGNTLAVFAMPPHEAATVLQAQEYSAIIAIIGS